MKKLLNGIDKTTTALSAALMAAVVAILVYNVFARFLGGGIKWYMEASQYLNVWAMFIAGIGICASGGHLRISALEGVMKGKAAKRHKFIISLLTVAFYLLLAYGTYQLAVRSRQVISTMAPLKMAYVYWVMPVTSVLSAAATALRALGEQTGTLEEGGGKA